jgi:hypothetical protein
MGNGSTRTGIVALVLFVFIFPLSLATRAGDTACEGNRAELGGRVGLAAVWRGEVSASFAMILVHSCTAMGMHNR